MQISSKQLRLMGTSAVDAVGVLLTGERESVGAKRAVTDGVKIGINNWWGQQCVSM